MKLTAILLAVLSVYSATTPMTMTAVAQQQQPPTLTQWITPPARTVTFTRTLTGMWEPTAVPRRPLQPLAPAPAPVPVVIPRLPLPPPPPPAQTITITSTIDVPEPTAIATATTATITPTAVVVIETTSSSVVPADEPLPTFADATPVVITAEPLPTDAPVTDAPVSDAPVTDAPVTDAPVTDAPVTDTTVTATTVTATPITATPITATPITTAKEGTDGVRVFILKEDHWDWPKGNEFNVYAESDLSKRLYRIRSFLRIPFQSVVVDVSSSSEAGGNAGDAATVVGTANKILGWKHDFSFNVDAVQGSISKCRFCLSRQWDIQWGQRKITVQGDVRGRNYQFFQNGNGLLQQGQQQGQIVGSMQYQWHPVRKDEWRLVASDPTLPNAFYLTALSAINEGS